jgi:hypothetical protein
MKLDFIFFNADKSFLEYCEQMIKDGCCCGGYPERVALSRSKKFNIIIPQLDVPKFEIISSLANSTLYLSCHMDKHYNSMLPVNKQVLDIHNSRISLQSQLHNNVQTVLQNVLRLWS